MEKNRYENSKNYLDKKGKKSLRLDFKTWLYLYITKALIVKHIPVVEGDKKRRMYVK